MENNKQVKYEDFNQLDTIDMNTYVEVDDDDFGGGGFAPQQPTRVAPQSKVGNLKVVYDDEDDIIEETPVVVAKPTPSNNEPEFDLPVFNMNKFESGRKGMKTITADIDDFGNVRTVKNYDADGNIKVAEPIADDGSNFNQLDTIDMECNIADDEYDDDFGGGSFKPSPRHTKSVSDRNYDPDLDYVDNAETGPKHYGVTADFDDEEDFIIKNGEVIMKAKPVAVVQKVVEVEPELVSEELVEKKSTPVTQGEVESDYLDRLAKRHKATNVKGAYNAHFHIGGNPEREMELLNHDLGSSTPVEGQLATGGESSGSGEATASVGAGEGSGCGESLRGNNYQKLFENLLVITGFQIIPTNTGNYTLKDKYELAPDIECQNSEQVLDELQPYIRDNFITPLQYTTGEKFKTPQEWCKWYTPEMEKKYPKCKSDIEYCDLLANHRKDFKF